MLRLKRILFLLCAPLLWISSQGFAAGPVLFLHEMPKIDPTDQASLQRGAKYYMNYCSGCHSLQFMRYERMAKDIGMTDDKGVVLADVVKANLMFSSDRIGDQINVAMNSEEARHWFGVAPPDLSLASPHRSDKWLYNYLLSFYVDDKRPWGVNNVVFPDVAMPNILLPLQGEQVPIYETRQLTIEGQSVEHKTITGLKLVKPGEMSPEEFQAVVYDIVNFMAYVGDPIKVQRERMGVAVILFLLTLLVFAYLLKREYWKDVK
ncbi:MAG TPA: cytochrome c1 [Gammaproteobacteria bacterium]|nr:cytochrome c1 [Gammaproteobacteria bacterium]